MRPPSVFFRATKTALLLIPVVLLIMIYPAHSFMPTSCSLGSRDDARSCQFSQRRPFSFQLMPATRRWQNSALQFSMMFDQLSGKLSGAMRRLSGQATITDKNIESALKEVKRSLLEADVNLDVAAGLVSDIRKRAIGMAVVEGVTPAQQFIKIMSVRWTFHA